MAKTETALEAMSAFKHAQLTTRVVEEVDIYLDQMTDIPNGLHVIDGLMMLIVERAFSVGLSPPYAALRQRLDYLLKDEDEDEDEDDTPAKHAEEVAEKVKRGRATGELS